MTTTIELVVVAVFVAFVMIVLFKSDSEDDDTPPDNRAWREKEEAEFGEDE